MKKLICVCVLAALCLLVMSGCKCEHEFADADCVTPKICTKCDEIEGEALGHTWVDADCVTPKICSVCKATEDEPLGHTWVDADCDTAKTCSVCAITEGEPAGHTWVDASCIAPKTCAACAATEGEILAHTWIAATTEAPKTCSVCQTTEGERIITDERFTTAACSGLFGTWQGKVKAFASETGISDQDEMLTYIITMKFANDGTMVQENVLEDPEHAENLMVDYLVRFTYAEMANQGYSQAQTDAEFITAMGMTLEEYYRSYIASQGGLGQPTVTEIVYYVDGTQLYVGMDWAEAMTPLEFTLEGDTLTLISVEGEPEIYTRIVETE